MADSPTIDAQALAGKLTDALADILRTSTTPDALQAQNILMRRLALEGDVFSSRVPPPRNITEVGGYLNILETLGESDMREQALAAILGVAGPNPAAGFTPTSSVLFDSTRGNDRPAGPAQPSIPIQFSIRNDFAPAFDAMLKIIHEAGCALPIFSTPRALPPVNGTAPLPDDLLPFLGRTLDLMPTAALVDPDADPLAVAHEDGSTTLQVVARQLDAAAPNAASVPLAKWSAIKCDANACAESSADRNYLKLTPLLNAAGWYQKAIVAPAKLSAPGSWSRWTNVTGLIPGVTKFGDEFTQRYSRGEFAATSLRDAGELVWDGSKFLKAP